MKCLLIKRADGGVSIITGETEEICLASKDQSATVMAPHEAFISHRFIDYDEYRVKAEQTKAEFRNAWCDETVEPSIDINSAKAKSLVLDSVRADRNIKLDATDKEMTRALETNASNLEELKAKRQELRDVTEPLKSLSPKFEVNDAEFLDSLKAAKAAAKASIEAV